MISAKGLTAIISIKIGDPQFEGQTKQKLGNIEARGATDSVVSEQLTYYLEQHPDVAKAICEKSVLAQRAREAARRARDLTRRKSALDGLALQENLRIAQTKIPGTAKYSWSREIPPAAAQRQQGAVQLRLFFRSAAKS